MYNVYASIINKLIHYTCTYNDIYHLLFVIYIYINNLLYTLTILLIHLCSVITSLATYKISKLKYVHVFVRKNMGILCAKTWEFCKLLGLQVYCAMRNCVLRDMPVDLAKVHYLNSFPMYLYISNLLFFPGTLAFRKKAV